MHEKRQIILSSHAAPAPSWTMHRCNKGEVNRQYPNSVFTKLMLSLTITTKGVFPFSINDTDEWRCNMSAWDFMWWNDTKRLADQCWQVGSTEKRLRTKKIRKKKGCIACSIYAERNIIFDRFKYRHAVLKKNTANNKEIRTYVFCHWLFVICSISLQWKRQSLHFPCHIHIKVESNHVSRMEMTAALCECWRTTEQFQLLHHIISVKS